MSEVINRTRRATRVTRFGIFWNVVLTIIKFGAGFLGNSSALIADAIHSFSDFVSDIAVLAGLKVAGKPKDASHHYGHGKFETLTILAITLTLLFAGGLMIYESVTSINEIFSGTNPKVPGMITLWIALISILIKEALFQYTIRAGKNISSDALITNAWHHRTDAFSSIAVSVGIAGSIFLGPDWRVLDPIAALIISVIVIRFALKIFIIAIDELAEASLGDKINQEILETVESVQGTIYPHAMKTRKIGPNYAIDLHIKVDPKLTIVEAHDIATEVEIALKNVYGKDTYTAIHVEPCERELLWSTVSYPDDLNWPCFRKWITFSRVSF